MPTLAILVFSLVAAGGMAGAQDASELDQIRREIKPIKAAEAVVRNLRLHRFPAKVPARSLSSSYSLWLGTAAASLFAILTVTAVMLMLF